MCRTDDPCDERSFTVADACCNNIAVDTSGNIAVWSDFHYVERQTDRSTIVYVHSPALECVRTIAVTAKARTAGPRQQGSYYPSDYAALQGVLTLCDPTSGMIAMIDENGISEFY